jgi:transposase
MAMGQRRKKQQGSLWVETARLGSSAVHPFYERLNLILDEAGFDEFVEGRCAGFYGGKVGRPSLAPAVYFRLLLIGYFEGIDSERGIAWRVADSLGLRRFLGFELSDGTPDHSTISRNRRLIDLETHEDVFSWIVRLLAKKGLIKGKTLGIDGTTLEANAAMRSIVRRDTGEKYDAFLERLAKESGIETPTREQMAKLDRNRPKKGSNKEWGHPHDPDARITKMKDGRTHLAHKAEHAVDMETGAIVAVTVQGADRGDAQSIDETLSEAAENLQEALEDEDAREGLSDELMSEIVADKGYHSNAVLERLSGEGARTYISEPNRGRRNWRGKADAKRATYANRRRIRGERGKKLLRRRGERVERSFAHSYDTGGMRRVHLRGHDNILKRVLIHAGAFNLGLVLRGVLGVGTPRGLQGRLRAVVSTLWSALRLLWHRPRPMGLDLGLATPVKKRGTPRLLLTFGILDSPFSQRICPSATGC